MDKNFTIERSGWVTCGPHAFELAPGGTLTHLRLSTDAALLVFAVGQREVTLTFGDVERVTLQPGPSWDVFIAGAVLRGLDDDAFLVEDRVDGPAEGLALWLYDGGVVRVIAGRAWMTVA